MPSVVMKLFILFRRIFEHFAPAICVLVLTLPACPQSLIPKKRVSVLNFEDYTGRSAQASKVFGAAAGDVGKGISAKLIEKLVSGDKYTVIDQSAVKKLLEEQASADDKRLNAYGRAAKIGRMLGIDALIVGAVTRLGPDNEHAAVGGAHSGMSTWKSKAYVDITARVLDMTNAEIIADFTITGESPRVGEITRIKGRGPSSAPQDILGSEFIDSLFGEATQNAIEKLAAKLNGFSEKIPTLHVEFDGLIAEVAGGIVTLNLGSKSGLKVGDQLFVMREVRNITETQTDAAISAGFEHIGEVRVSAVDEQSSTAIFSGPGQVRVGDRVKSASAPPIVAH